MIWTWSSCRLNFWGKTIFWKHGIKYCRYGRKKSERKVGRERRVGETWLFLVRIIHASHSMQLTLCWSFRTEDTHYVTVLLSFPLLGTEREINNSLCMCLQLERSYSRRKKTYLVSGTDLMERGEMKLSVGRSEIVQSYLGHRREFELYSTRSNSSIHKSLMVKGKETYWHLLQTRQCIKYWT